MNFHSYSLLFVLSFSPFRASVWVMFKGRAGIKLFTSLFCIISDIVSFTELFQVWNISVAVMRTLHIILLLNIFLYKDHATEKIRKEWRLRSTFVSEKTIPRRTKNASSSRYFSRHYECNTQHLTLCAFLFLLRISVTCIDVAHTSGYQVFGVDCRSETHSVSCFKLFFFGGCPAKGELITSRRNVVTTVFLFFSSEF